MTLGLVLGRCHGITCWTQSSHEPALIIKWNEQNVKMCFRCIKFPRIRSVWGVWESKKRKQKQSLPHFILLACLLPASFSPSPLALFRESMVMNSKDIFNDITSKPLERLCDEEHQDKAFWSQGKSRLERVKRRRKAASGSFQHVWPSSPQTKSYRVSLRSFPSTSLPWFDFRQCVVWYFCRLLCLFFHSAKPPQWAYNQLKMKTFFPHQHPYEDPRTENLRKLSYGVILPIICTLGILGNVLNLIVLTRRNMRGTAYIYMRGEYEQRPLIFLAVFDSMKYRLIHFTISHSIL